MAASTYYLSPISLLIQIFSNIGIPLQGGFLQTLLAGSSTPVTTYTDATGTTQNANPIPLSSAGRLQSAGGAPVTCWLPAGVAHKMVITDSGGNFILGLDNLTSINDPTALLSLLAGVTSGGILRGADLIANSIRSYDVVASVRAAPVPSLAAGQTLVIDIEGGILINDGNGGLFYWSATSTASDDGITVIKPNATPAANPGRYLRQTNLFGVLSSFTMTVTGCTTAPVLTCQAVNNGNLITVQVPPSGNLTSNSTSFGLNFWPAALRDNVLGFTSNLFPAQDNGTLGISAYVQIANAIGSNSAIITPNNASGLWTASGTKSFNGFSFTYQLPNGHP